MLEPDKKFWETPEFKELEIPEQFKKLWGTIELEELEKIVKLALDSLNNSTKELHNIYQELHEINRTLKKIK